MDRSLRLAVTGLSRSGKTVFTVSLVYQPLLRLLDAMFGEIRGKMGSRARSTH